MSELHRRRASAEAGPAAGTKGQNPSIDELETRLKRTVEELEAFTEIGKVLTSTLDIHEVLRRIMEKVHELLKPANWSLLLVEPESGSLVFEVAKGAGAERLAGERIGLDEGIAGWVVSRRTPLLVEDVRKDPRFSSRFDAATLFTTRSILAAPLCFGDHSLGVIELVKGPNEIPFLEEDLRTLTTIADYAAIALENAWNFRKVQELTILDEHTGLFNARHLAKALEAEVERAHRFEHPLSLIFFDLDHFKQVNDRHGHQVGSSVLAGIGEILRRTLRSVDVAVRYGGDEFVCLLPETEKAHALFWARQIQAAIREHAFTSPAGGEIRVDASFGVAAIPEDAGSAEELLRKADLAMYRVKQGGRGDIAAA